MKESSNSHENVVQFPHLGAVSEDFGHRDSEQISDAELYGSDPLEDLLNEFEDITDSIENEEAKKVLARVVEKMQLPEDILAQEFSSSNELKSKIRLLEEVNQRIKYYLDEVELFIPKLKK